MFKDFNKKQIITINDANKLYKILGRKKGITSFKFLKIVKNKPHILLSYFFNRNIFFSETCSIDTMYLAGRYTKKLESNLKPLLTTKFFFPYDLGFFISGNYTSLIKLLINSIRSLCRFIVHFIVSIVDTIFISLIIITLLSINNLKKERKKFLLKSKKSLYSFILLKSRIKDSPTYFYPDINKKSSRAAFAASFYGYRFYSFALLDAYKINNIYTFLDFVKIDSYFKSIMKIIDILLFEFIILIKEKKYSNFINLINGLTTINLRFISLMNMESTNYLKKYKNISKYYLWQEGIIPITGFNIGLNNNKKDCNYTCFSYIGTTYISNYYEHYAPNRFDLISGLWSKSILVHDKDSKIEMQEKLKRLKLNLKINICRDKMRRFVDSKTGNNKILFSRNIVTYFTHGSMNELNFCLREIINNKSIYKKILDTNNILYIKPHPSLDMNEIRSIIYRINLEYKEKSIKIILLERKEDILKSLLKSNIAIFGESTYVNLAIKLGIQVICLRTSYLFNTPILKKYIKRKNLKII